MSQRVRPQKECATFCLVRFGMGGRQKAGDKRLGKAASAIAAVEPAHNFDMLLKLEE